jgi:hypothetical protein
LQRPVEFVAAALGLVEHGRLEVIVEDGSDAARQLLREVNLEKKRKKKRRTGRKMRNLQL